MPDTLNLKPCPFCGADASISNVMKEGKVISYTADCDLCSCEIGGVYPFPTAEEAARQWNIRIARSEIPVIEKEAVLNTLGDLKKPWEALRPYVNATPELISLLYDLDLMPEQIHVRRNFIRMMQLAEWHKHYAPKRESIDHVGTPVTFEWHPISTIPKDKAVLVYDYGYTIGHLNTALGKIVSCYDHTPLPDVTHWMPLPYYPTKIEGGKP